MKKEYEFPLANNLHAHLREGEMLVSVAPYFNIYEHVICMGNLKKPIVTVRDALAYREMILNQGIMFKPLICLMITRDTSPWEMIEAAKLGFRYFKLMPSGATTNASEGVFLDSYDFLFPLFEVMVDYALYLLVHAEQMSTKEGNRILYQLREESSIGYIARYFQYFPELPITIEHVSTRAMINFIDTLPTNANVGMTLTLQHATFSYNDAYYPGDVIKDPFNHCYPCLKSKADVIAVRKKMCSGDKNCWLGSDAAPHLELAKLKATKKPGGIFYGEAELPGYLEVFDDMGKLDNWPAFSSYSGADHYDLPGNTGTYKIVREEWTSPVVDNGIRFCQGGKTMRFKITDINR